MPSEKVLKEKQQVVVELSEKIKSAMAAVIVDYKGITVADDTKLRSDLRKNNVDYSVVKNTLTRFALKEVGIEGLDEVLNGTSALAISTSDVMTPAKVLCEFADKHKNFSIKGGIMEGKVISVDEIQALAKIPSKEILLSKMLGSMMAPISGFARVLNAIAQKQEEQAS